MRLGKLLPIAGGIGNVTINKNYVVRWSRFWLMLGRRPGEEGGYFPWAIIVDARDWSLPLSVRYRISDIHFRWELDVQLLCISFRKIKPRA